MALPIACFEPFRCRRNSISLLGTATSAFCQRFGALKRGGPRKLVLHVSLIRIHRQLIPSQTATELRCKADTQPMTAEKFRVLALEVRGALAPAHKILSSMGECIAST